MTYQKKNTAKMQASCSGVDEKVSFSVDLINAAQQQIKFLRAVHASGISLNAPSKLQFVRYEEHWLPLLAKNNTIIPPLDVAWLWHCHRLAPIAYNRACEQHKLPRNADVPETAFHYADSSLSKESSNSSNLSTTIDLWKKQYPMEPYFFTHSFLSNHEATSGKQWIAPKHLDNGGKRDYGIISGFDLIESCERQASFLWQVSDYSYSDRAFLEDGVVNYHRFLKLIGNNPGQFMVPTYQIDLIWHSHILASMNGYCNDCEAIAGIAMIDHDDSVSDRSSPDTKLNVSTKQTDQLWKEAYNLPYEGLFRGHPPAEFWTPRFVEMLKVSDVEISKRNFLFNVIYNQDYFEHEVDSTAVVGGAPPTTQADEPNIVSVELVAPPTMVSVSIPKGVQPGATLSAVADGVTFNFQVPAGAKAGDVIQVQAPAVSPAPAPQSPTMVSVSIPKGVQPGATLSAVADGVSFNFQVPAGAKAGDVIQVQAPASTSPMKIPTGIYKSPLGFDFDYPGIDRSVAKLTHRFLDYPVHPVTITGDTIFGFPVNELEGMPIFVKPVPKAERPSAIKLMGMSLGVNDQTYVPTANPPMTGYVFGKGASGVGYYRLDQPDADDIIVDRLKRSKVEAGKSAQEMHFCCCVISNAILVRAAREQVAMCEGLLVDKESRANSMFQLPGYDRKFGAIQAAACGVTGSSGGAACGALLPVQHHSSGGGGGCGGGCGGG